MTFEEKKKLYAALAAPFPEECVQRTDGRTTGRGYSTSGIGYQFVVNRLNEVLGVGGFRAHRTLTVKEITRSNGRPAFEAICDLTLELGTWEGGQFVVFAESLADGGHIAASEADARKGSYTNAFKKAAGFFGVGRQAYEGSLDDDNQPTETEIAQGFATSTNRSRAPNAPPASEGPPASIPAAPSALARPIAAAGAVTQRNRLSSKQLSAIWSIARKLGHEQSSFRNKVKAEFGKSLEFLSKEEASSLIGRLSAHINGNGAGPGISGDDAEVA